MAYSYHKSEPLGSRHPAVSWVAADAASRKLLAVTASDIGGFAWQSDLDTVWLLKSVAPPVWVDVSEARISPGALLDGEYQAIGAVEVVTVAENTVGAGAVLTRDVSDGEFYMADAASAVARVDNPGLVVESGTGSKRIMFSGYYRSDSWAWTPGGMLWIGISSGLLTQTEPIAPNYYQRVGFAVSATTVRFEPTGSLLKLK